MYGNNDSIMERVYVLEERDFALVPCTEQMFQGTFQAFQYDQIFQQFNNGALERLDPPRSGLRRRISDALLDVRQPTTCTAGAYTVLMKNIRQLIQTQRAALGSMVNREHEFKAILDGLLTALSSFISGQGINVIVAPEFQVGGGGRVDLAIQAIQRMQDGSYRTGVLILMELKFFNTQRAAENFLTLNYHMEGTINVQIDHGRLSHLRAGQVRERNRDVILREGDLVRFEHSNQAYIIRGGRVVEYNQPIQQGDRLQVLEEGEVYNLHGSQLIYYLRSKNLKALTDGWEVAILPVAFIRGDCTIDVPTVQENGNRRIVFIVGPVYHSSLEHNPQDPPNPNIAVNNVQRPFGNFGVNR